MELTTTTTGDAEVVKRWISKEGESPSPDAMVDVASPSMRDTIPWFMRSDYFDCLPREELYAHLSNVMDMVRKQQACFWVAEEIDLYQDLRDWDGLKEEEKHFIKYVLAFFAASDGIVLENLASRFIREIKVPQIRSFYSFQTAMENIHSETYSLLIDVYLRDEGENTSSNALQIPGGGTGTNTTFRTERERLFHAIETVPAVEKKAKWAVKWMNHSNSFAERLVAFCAVEGILFSGSFCAIFWLKKRGLLPGLTFSNELISRDEGLHTDFGVLLYNTLPPSQRLPQEHVHHIITEALDVERYFILEALPVDLIGMNSRLMNQYLECVADRLLECMNYAKIWHSENPFDWMELISVPGKTNFFEKRVGDYQQSGTLANKEEQVFNMDVEF